MSRFEILHVLLFGSQKDSCICILLEFDIFLYKMALNHKCIQSGMRASAACGPK